MESSSLREWPLQSLLLLLLLLHCALEGQVEEHRQASETLLNNDAEQREREVSLLLLLKLKLPLHWQPSNSREFKRRRRD